MRIDLHTHSAVSDGTDTPAELVRTARRQGLDVVALTDHDTAAGWDEAVEAAGACGIELVRGMEISTKNHGRGCHLLAYLPDPTAPALAALLGRIIGGRDDRLPLMLAALSDAGVELAEDDVHGPADGGPIGRPHVADALVRAGLVADRTEAFDRYLSAGRPGYVDRYAPDVREAIVAVRAAGGVSVVAHAWGRHGRRALTPQDLDELVAVGLSGLEVDHQDHAMDDRRALLGLARQHDLVVTGSSDYHGTGKTDHDLGCHLTDSEEYRRLLERCERAAAPVRAAGRDVPRVVEGGPRP